MVEVDGEIYVITYNESTGANTFGKIDPVTGAFTSIKPSGAPDFISMAYNPVDGLVYGAQWGSETSSPFGTINLTNGNFTSKGSVPGYFYIAIDDAGICYGYGMGSAGSKFGTVSLANGAFSQITTAHASNTIQDLVFDTETGTLYHIQHLYSDNNSILETINKTTGAITEIGEMANNVHSIIIRPSGAPTDVTITTEVLPAGTGTVTGGGTYAVGAPVTLTASANTGYQFDKWTPGNATTNPLTFNATVDATYTANFISTSCNPPTNLLIAYAEDCNAAVLTWTAPEGTGLAYNIYRGTEKLNETPVTVTTFTDDTFENIGHTWFVKTVCGDAESGSIDKTLGICDLGIKEHTLSFSIVPSPAQDYIKISAVVNFNTVDVINFLGQTVLTQSVEGNSIILDISNLTNGVYFVQIASEKTTSVKKFVKQ
jgi:hypothetical protein